jgi:lysophospholipase L1-like esterase
MVSQFDSITQKMNRIEKGNESKNEKIKVEIQTVKSVANNLKESMELMIADTKETTKIIKESLKVQNKTLEAVKELNSKTELNDDTSTTEIVEAPVVEEELVVSKDKGVILTSPIGKNMNKERLEQATDSDIEIVPTYHLENKAGARDPDKHLIAMSDKHVNKKTSWVGIAVGTNDITDLPNEWADQKEVLESVKKQTEFLVQSAKTMVSQHNVDVFVFEQPPRFDKKVLDPEGNWAKFSKLANSHLAIMLAGEEKIHIVENTNLARPEGKSRDDLYQPDGLHLTPKGLYNLETNVISALHKVKPNLQTLEVHKKTPKTPKVGQPQGREDFKAPPPGQIHKKPVRGKGSHQYQQQYQGFNQQQQYQGFNQQQQYQDYNQQQKFGQPQQGQYQEQQYWGPQQGHGYGFPQHYNTNQWQGYGGW